MAGNYSEDSYVQGGGMLGTGEWRTDLHTDDGWVEVRTTFVSDRQAEIPSGYWATTVSRSGSDGAKLDEEYSSNGMDEAKAVHNAMCEKWDGHEAGFIHLDDFDTYDRSDLNIKPQEIGITEPIEYTENTDQLDEKCDLITAKLAGSLVHNVTGWLSYEVILDSIGYYNDGERPALAEAMDRNQNFQEFKVLADRYIEKCNNEDDAEKTYDEKHNDITLYADLDKFDSIIDDAKIHLAEARDEVREAKQELEDFVDRVLDASDLYDEIRNRDKVDTGTMARSGVDTSEDLSKVKMDLIEKFNSDERPALSESLEYNQNFKDFTAAYDRYNDADNALKYKQEEYDYERKFFDSNLKYGDISLDEWKEKLSDERESLRDAKSDFNEAKQELLDCWDRLSNDLENADTDITADEGENKPDETLNIDRDTSDSELKSEYSNEAAENSDIEDENLTYETYDQYSNDGGNDAENFENGSAEAMSKHYSEDSHYIQDNGTDQWSTTVQTEDGPVIVDTAWIDRTIGPERVCYWETIVYNIEPQTTLEISIPNMPTFDVERITGGVDEAEAMHNAMCEKWDGHEGGFNDIDSSDFDGNTQKLGLNTPIGIIENADSVDERSDEIIADFAEELIDNHRDPSFVTNKIEAKLESMGYYKDGERPLLAEALDNNPNFQDFWDAEATYVDAFHDMDNAENEYKDTMHELHDALNDGQLSVADFENKSEEARAEYREVRADLNEAKQGLQDIVDRITQNDDDVDTGMTAENDETVEEQAIETSESEEDTNTDSVSDQSDRIDTDEDNKDTRYSRNDHFSNIDDRFGMDKWYTDVPTHEGNVGIYTEWVSTDSNDEKTGYWQTTVYRVDENSYAGFARLPDTFGPTVDFERSYGGIDEAAAVHDAMCEKWDGYERKYADIDDNGKFTQFIRHPQEVGLSEPVEFIENSDGLDKQCDYIVEDFAYSFMNSSVYSDDPHEILDYKLNDFNDITKGINEKLASIGYFMDGERPALAEALDKNTNFADFKEAAEDFVKACDKEMEVTEDGWQNDLDEYDGKISTEEWNNRNEELDVEHEKIDANYYEAKQSLNDVYEHAHTHYSDTDNGTTAEESDADNETKEDTDKTNDTSQGDDKNVDKETEAQDDKELATKLASIKDEILEAVSTIVSDMIDELIKELGNDVSNDDDNIETESKTGDEVEENSNPDNANQAIEQTQGSEEDEIETPPIDTEEETDYFEECLENFDDEYNDYYEDWGDDL